MPALAIDNWRLESFIDALIFELDKAQDTLSVKGINRKLTYSVRDVAVDLNVFPEYRDDELRFAVARPGDAGASRITFQLGSITDSQIRETTRDPISASDITIDEVDDIDPDLKTRLKRSGVTSARDLERMKVRNVALPAVVGRKEGTQQDGEAVPDDSNVSYKFLADVINKARRQRTAPSAKALSLVGATPDSITICLSGDNLDDPSATPGYPIAMLRGAEMAARREDENIVIEIPRPLLQRGANSVALALDPATVVDFELGWSG